MKQDSSKALQLIMPAVLPGSPRRPVRVLYLSLLAVASLAVSVQAQSPSPEMPPIPPRFRTPPSTTITSAKTRDAFRDQMQRYYEPPFSRIAVPGATVYSRNVNRLLCAVTVPAVQGKPECTWLGTYLGVKRVQKGKGTVRQYTQADGLPGDIVLDIVADANGAAALVQTATQEKALCWWDNKMDRWRELARLPLVRTITSVYWKPDIRWRFVLTANGLVLVPPIIAQTRGAVLSSTRPEDLTGHLTVWRRNALQAGRDLPLPVAWDDDLTNIRRWNNPVIVTGLTTLDGMVFLGGDMGIVCIPDALLSPDASSAPADASLLSAAPRMPRFRPDSQVFHLTAGPGKLWVALRSGDSRRVWEIVALTAVRKGNTFAGFEQRALPLPSDTTTFPSVTESMVFRGPKRIVAAGGDLWFLSEYGLLRFDSGTKSWERRDGDGKGVALNAYFPPREIGQYRILGVYPSYPVNLPPVLAPPASELPDVVAQAWLLEMQTSTMSYGSERSAAWIRQRFPAYFSRPVTPPRYTAHHNIAAFSVDRDTTRTTSAYTLKRDPLQPDIVWGVLNSSIPDVLWRFTSPSPQRDAPPLVRQQSAHTIPPWHFAYNLGLSMIPVVGPISWAGAKDVALPILPARVHLTVTGMAVRPEGLFVGTKNGIMLLPPAALEQPETLGAGAHWVPQQTDSGLQWHYNAGTTLYSVGPETTLLTALPNTTGRLLRYEPSRKQFVRDDTLPIGAIVQGSMAGLFLHPPDADSAASSTSATPSLLLRQLREVLRFVPFHKGQVDASKAASLRLQEYSVVPGSDAILLTGTGYPFLNQSPDQIGISDGRIWFIGRITPPARLRYSNRREGSEVYAISGYDMTRKQWTTLLEMPGSTQSHQASVLEEDGNTLVTMEAPDSSVWQYQEKSDEWQAVAPALPAIAHASYNTDAAPQLWTARGGDAWMLFDRAVYHHAPNATSWTRQVEPLPFADLIKRSFKPSLTLFGNGLLAGTSEGLWRFDRTTHTWAEVAPLASSLEATPAYPFFNSLAAARDAIYLSGEHYTDGSYPNDPFLLKYDRKSTWSILTSQELGISKIEQGSRFTFDGVTVWYSDSRQIRRRDPATGRWQAIATEGWQQIVPDPAAPGSIYLRDTTTIRYYDAVSGKLRIVWSLADAVLGAIGKRPLADAPRINDITTYRNTLLVSTPFGLFRVRKDNGTADHLRLPLLENAVTFPEDNGAVFAWDENTIIHLPR